MSDHKSLKVANETFTEFSRLQYRLAADMAKRVTADTLIRALSIVGSAHYDELTSALTEPETSE